MVVMRKIQLILSFKEKEVIRCSIRCLGVCETVPRDATSALGILVRRQASDKATARQREQLQNANLNTTTTRQLTTPSDNSS